MSDNGDAGLAVVVLLGDDGVEQARLMLIQEASGRFVAPEGLSKWIAPAGVDLPADRVRIVGHAIELYVPPGPRPAEARGARPHRPGTPRMPACASSRPAPAKPWCMSRSAPRPRP